MCQKPTPAVNAIASAVVKLSTNSATSAVAISDGAIETFKGAGSPICAKSHSTICDKDESKLEYSNRFSCGKGNERERHTRPAFK